MQINDTNTNDTYSQTLVHELNLQANTKKMKKLTFLIIILDILLIISLFLSFNALLYAIFILLQILITVGIAIYCIKFNKVSDQAYKIQRSIVFGFTIVQAIFILSLCIFGLVTTSKQSTIISIVFQVMVPGVIVIMFKMWIIFVKRKVQERAGQQEMKIQGEGNFYTYKEIQETKGKQIK